jgi:KipI family sensor histidine kinase inhibitor
MSEQRHEEQHMRELHLRPYGEGAWLLEVPAEHVPATYAAVRALVEQGRLSAREVVPGARTVLLDGVAGVDADELLTAVGERAVAAEQTRARAVEVPTRYDGADLEDVARLWDMTTDEVVATHSATEFTVVFCGFAPGFAYCAGLPDHLHVPRHDTPRQRVPAGSVGVAGGFTGIYPTASPGGWRLLGRTDLDLWDSSADPPATLAPGTAVRFVEVSR